MSAQTRKNPQNPCVSQKHHFASQLHISVEFTGTIIQIAKNIDISIRNLKINIKN